MQTDLNTLDTKDQTIKETEGNRLSAEEKERLRKELENLSDDSYLPPPPPFENAMCYCPPPRDWGGSG